MKKRLFKILSVVMTLLLFVGIGVGVNAYSLDSNGNIVSDNLLNYQNINSTAFTDLGENSFKINWRGAVTTITMPYSSFEENTQYSFTLTSLNGAKYWAYNLSWNYTDNTSENFTQNQALDYGTYSFTSSANKTISTITWTVNFEADFSNLMFNKGEPKSYEPYGSTWYSENNSQIKQAIGLLANTNNIVVELTESGDIYNTETYSNFFDLPWITSYGQISIPIGVFENWNESEHENAMGTITFNYSNGIVPTNTYNTIYLITWQYYTNFKIKYYDGTSQNFQSTGDSIQVTNPSNTYIKSIQFGTEYLANYGPNITFALDNNYSSGYSNGYSHGYELGYEYGYDSGSSGKYDEGYTDGYNEGYTDGYEDNPEDKTLYNMILAIADVPITLFTQIFNFDILGVNIAGFVTSLVSIAIIVWLVKFFI